MYELHFLSSAKKEFTKLDLVAQKKQEGLIKIIEEEK